MKHKTEHGEFTAVTSSCPQQLTLQQTLVRCENFSMDNPSAKKISEVVTQFIVLDDQPLSIVDNVGFWRLMNLLEPKYEIPSHRHVTDVMLPQLHNKVKKHITNMLQEDIKAISFTTNIWSSSVSPVSVISLTAHDWGIAQFSAVCHHPIPKLPPYQITIIKPDNLFWVQNGHSSLFYYTKTNHNKKL